MFQPPAAPSKEPVFTALGRGDSNFAYSYGTFCRDLPVAGFHCFWFLKIKDW